MVENEWADHQEVLLRDCDMLHTQMMNRLTLRYQVAVLFITLIVGYWTAVAILYITSDYESVTKPFSLILFGLLLSASFLFLWRLATHKLIDDDTGDEIAFNTKQLCINIKKPRPKLGEEADWEKLKEEAKTNMYIITLGEFIKNSNINVPDEQIKKIRALDLSKKTELIENTNFEKYQEFSEGIACYDRYALISIILELISITIVFIITFLSFIPFNYVLSGNITDTFCVKFDTFLICMESACVCILLIFIILLFEYKFKTLRRELILKNEIKDSIVRELSKIQNEEAKKAI
jgi:hypothetical protein